jgi:hypothetical protein
MASMVKMDMPKTLTKVAVLYDDLESRVKKFSKEAKPVAVGFGNTLKYGLYNENPPYLMMVSQQKDKILNAQGYNLILTITSDSDNLNNQIYEDFRQKTNMELREASESLAEMMQAVGVSFVVFKKYGQKAMDVLAGLG